MTCSALLRSSRYAASGALEGDGETLGCATAPCVGDAVGAELAPELAFGAAAHAAVSRATNTATPQASFWLFVRKLLRFGRCLHYTATLGMVSSAESTPIGE